MIGNIMVLVGSMGKGRPRHQLVRIYAQIMLRVLGPYTLERRLAGHTWGVVLEALVKVGPLNLTKWDPDQQANLPYFYFRNR